MTTRAELQAVMDRPGFGTGRAQENEALALLPDPEWMAPVMASTDPASNRMISSFGNSGEAPLYPGGRHRGEGGRNG